MKLKIKVYDHSPENHDPPIIECPALFGGVEVGVPVAEIGSYYRYDVTFSNEKLTAQPGYYKALVSSLDLEGSGIRAYQFIFIRVADMSSMLQIQNFNAWNGEYPGYGPHWVRLEWDGNPAATYAGQREYYDFDEGQWMFEDIELFGIQVNGTHFSAADKYCPYGGPGRYSQVDHIDEQGKKFYSQRPPGVKYRIKAVLNGCEWSWAETTGYPKMRNIEVAIINLNDGQNDAVDSTRIANDILNANLFWNQYGINFDSVLQPYIT